MLPIEDYINQIIKFANLAKTDEQRVRRELENHLQELLNNGQQSGLTESEVIAMLEREFGNPEELGNLIAKAKGKFRTYLKKEARKLPIELVVTFVVISVVYFFVAQPFTVKTDSISPVVPQNSRILVNKLTHNFRANDIIVFRAENGKRCGIIKAVDKDNHIIVSRKGEPDNLVSRDNIIGKAFFLYSFSL